MNDVCSELSTWETWIMNRFLTWGNIWFDFSSTEWRKRKCPQSDMSIICLAYVISLLTTLIKIFKEWADFLGFPTIFLFHQLFAFLLLFLLNFTTKSFFFVPSYYPPNPTSFCQTWLWFSSSSDLEVVILQIFVRPRTEESPSSLFFLERFPSNISTLVCYPRLEGQAFTRIPCF